ncbi:MAG: M23 family metallopeptidase [Ignavibacteriales bacterium]|nr:M23 family metallopeptidase [Ignavibacteriales bacterium]
MIPRRTFTFGLLASFLFHPSFHPSPLSFRIDLADSSPGDKVDEIYAAFETLDTDLGDYGWPTEASTVLTSGFAEFRTTHFHAGIDISTWNRTGYKVLASRDGYVDRISVSPYGYGKMLILRHPDGYSTLYAHLQRFSDVIDKHIRAAQYASGRYSAEVELPPNEIQVRKGEVVAYTGNTGIGSPHLHFEIRDERRNPINPFLVPQFTDLIEDTTPPIFEAIAFTPLDYSSLVQGDHRPWNARVKKLAPREYRLDGPVRFAGSIGVSVKAFDRANHSYHRNSIRTFEFYVDSLLIFNARLDRFPAREAKQIGLHYDWGMIQKRKGRFQRLYIEPGNRLPVYERLPEGSGVIDGSLLAEGLHSFRVVAADDRGHTSELRGTFIFGRPPAFDVKTSGQSVSLHPAEASAVRTVHVARRTGNGWQSHRQPLTELTPTEHGYVLPGKFTQGSTLRVELENTFGILSAPHFVVPGIAGNRKTTLRLEKEFFRDYLYLTITASSSFIQEPRVSVQSASGPSQILPTAKDLRKYVAAIPFTCAYNDTLRVEVQASTLGGISLENLEIPVYLVSTDGSKTILPNDDVTIFFPRDAVYQPAFIRVEPTKEGYMLHPREIVLNKGVHVRYLLKDPKPRLGLFVSEERGWELLAYTESGTDEALTGRLSRQLGEVALLSDHAPPTISNFVSNHRRGRLSFSFWLSDAESGVDYNRTRITLDDELIIAEYDPYRHLVKFDESRGLPNKVHRLAIEVYDKMGNNTAKAYNVRRGTR